jgi:hypothetical protein
MMKALIWHGPSTISMETVNEPRIQAVFNGGIKAGQTLTILGAGPVASPLASESIWNDSVTPAR